MAQINPRGIVITKGQAMATDETEEVVTHGIGPQIDRAAGNVIFSPFAGKGLAMATLLVIGTKLDDGHGGG